MTHQELKALRLAMCLTPEGMAKRLGIRQRMYYYIENGEKPLSKASSLLAEQLAKNTTPKSDK